MFVDSHCHLDFPDLIENEAAILERMAENGVTHALCVSVKLETLPAVIGLAERHVNLFASVGVHPANADCDEPDEAKLLEL
ncbi:MAG TPA: TatD family hydrolase, partial [Zoogloea sp.]|nr:TatD family hydrolase [Zoogloea sp.]